MSFPSTSARLRYQGLICFTPVLILRAHEPHDDRCHRGFVVARGFCERAGTHDETRRDPGLHPVAIETRRPIRRRTRSRRIAGTARVSTSSSRTLRAGCAVLRIPSARRREGRRAAGRGRAGHPLHQGAARSARGVRALRRREDPSRGRQPPARSAGCCTTRRSAVRTPAATSPSSRSPGRRATSTGRAGRIPTSFARHSSRCRG